MSAPLDLWLNSSFTLFPFVAAKVWAQVPYPFTTVSFFFGAPVALLAHYSPRAPYPPDEAFATKHMTDLGHDIEEFQAFHWNLRGWNKLEKKLTSLKFDCGGHKWYVLLHLSHSRNF